MKTGSRVHPIILVILAAAACLSLPLRIADAMAQDVESLGGNDRWWDGFAPPGAVGPIDRTYSDAINAAVLFEGDIVVAGDFRYMDGVAVPGIARWTDKGWKPFDSTGLPLTIEALAVHDGTLIAGGYYIESNETAASNLYRYTAAGWEPFGPEILRTPRNYVTRLKVVGDDLYVLAIHEDSDPSDVPSPVVARWDGSTWETIGIWPWLRERNGTYAPLYDVDVYQGDLILAGRFVLDASDTVGYVARWTGSELELLGGGADDRVYALTVHDGRLFAGGLFTRIGDQDSGPVASWNGSQWTPLGTHLKGFSTDRPGVRYFLTAGQTLYAYGTAYYLDTIATSHLLVWDGAGWQGTPWYWSDYVGFGSLIDYEGRPLYAGDLDVGTRNVEGLARWDGESWMPFPDHGITLNAPPTAFLPTEDGLIVAGEFTRPGSFAASPGIARWNGSTWTMLADYLNAAARALIVYRGHLVAGGYFTRVDGDDANHIAMLGSDGWKQVGNGMDDVVLALEVYDGRLIAGGGFHEAGSRSAHLIAAWNGLSWQSLGSGLPGGGSVSVNDLQIYGGKLVAGGEFMWAGDKSVTGMAAWDGTEWLPMGSASTFLEDSSSRPRFFQLVPWRGRLVARGNLDSVAGQPANDLAVWDGEAWGPLFPDLKGAVGPIGVYQDRLVVSGFVELEDLPYYETGQVIQYDGDRWWTMGSGLTWGTTGRMGPSVTQMAIWKGGLYFGGHFETAGGKPSLYFARWDGTGLAPLPVPRLRAAPNPAREQSTIAFRLDAPGQTAVQVFDIQGRRVRTLHDGFMTGGDHTATWDLRDAGGRRVSAGVYFLRVDSPFSRATEKVVVIR